MDVRRNVATLVVTLFLFTACGGGGGGKGGSGSGSSNGGGSGSNGGQGSSGSTTLANETANNTSGSSAYTDRYYNYVTNTITTADNPIPGNISDVNIHKLFSFHGLGKVLVENQSWFRHDPNNIRNGKLVDNAHAGSLDVGYDSVANAPNQVADMVRRGVDGSIVNWYGPGTEGDQAMKAMQDTSLSKYGGRFEISPVIDKGAFDHPQAPCNNLSNNTAVAKCFLNYIKQKYVSRGAFVKTPDGRAAIFWFITYFPVDATVDWVSVHNYAASQGLALIIDNTAGFSFYNSDGASDGAYSWVGHTLDYMNSFFSAAESHPHEVPYAGLADRFNDVHASWTGNRHLYGRCGMNFLEKLKLSDSQNINWAGLVLATWDDYAEGTELETGIDNCLRSVNVSITGGQLTFSPQFGKDAYGNTGNESTIDHYQVFFTSDMNSSNPRLSQLGGDVGADGTGHYVFNIGSYSLPAGSYRVYVKAVSQPFMHNRMSGPVTYTVGSADTAGTTMHAQMRAGGAAMTGTLSSGVVQILAPSNEAKISGSRVHVSAQASADKSINSMYVFVDGVQAGPDVSGSRLDAFVNLSTGTHNITVTAKDEEGEVYSESTTVVGTADNGKIEGTWKLTAITCSSHASANTGVLNPATQALAMRLENGTMLFKAAVNSVCTATTRASYTTSDHVFNADRAVLTLSPGCGKAWDLPTTAQSSHYTVNKESLKMYDTAMSTGGLCPKGDVVTVTYEKVTPKPAAQ